MDAQRMYIVKYQFTRQIVDVYSFGVYNASLGLDPFTPLEEVTQDCQSHCIKQPQMPFPTKWAMPPNLVQSYKIIGMMRNVMIQGDACSVK